MALVSLAVAKSHLRVTDDDSNADIQLKADQASAIVLKHLKSQANAIASISVANPTVITTPTAHGLVSGTTYTINGTTTTPTVNGAQVVTVTGPTTFTVPVNVTVGQSTAAGTVGTPVWTEATVPGSVTAATLLMLGHLYEHRGDDMAGSVSGGQPDVQLWQAVERLLVGFRDPTLA